MSYRGRTLIINNLVASALWHRLACVDPPAVFFGKLQSILVNFFWDKLHWTPQSVLFLQREEGGQGLVHLASRGATFRLQYIQRYLTGPKNLVWREVTSTILKQAGGLGLDSTLFLMDCNKVPVNGLPPFYKGLFKVWSFFIKQRLESNDSLFWLLEEPLIGGARFDVSCETIPGISYMLRDK